MKVLGSLPYIDFQVRCEGNAQPMFHNYCIENYLFLVMDDENPTEVTAGAIVTVTVTLIRKDMSVLFGDETVVENSIITENGIDHDKEKAAGDAPAEGEQAVKRPAWLKQKRGDLSFTAMTI